MAATTMIRYPDALNTRRGRELVQWIADMDNNGDDEDWYALAGYISVTMLAHVYRVPAIQIAKTVWMLRHPNECEPFPA